MRATESELRRYFRKKVGCKVNEIIMLRDKRTGQHKGCAYVELRTMPDVQRALAVSGAAPDFQKFPVQVKASEAEKNYVVPTQSLTASMMGQKTNTSPLIDKEGQPYESQKVYLGNLDPRVANEQLFQLFSSFGTLSKVQIQSDPQTGVSRGFAFLSFRDPKDANLAIQIMSGQLLAGRAMKTGWASQPSSTAGVQVRTTEENPPDATRKIQKAHNVLFQLTGAGLTGTAAATFLSNNGGGTLTTVPTAAVATPSPDVPLNATTTPASTSPVTPAASPVDAKVIGRADNPSEYLLIHNMFNKDEETDPNWEEDIRLDFEEECSKYGKLLKVVVMWKEPGGKIYARFSAINEAKTCASNLAGRWFDKRQLRVEYVDELPSSG
uniref:RRM domain-containing protein n=1 Tax=Grammatophora oceanica TaxID=210454 RepID=A0A7S1YLA3_9STRA|mmetsp:Transcript_53234/g.79503  ORF Transcript_53234/g.79503 Transcript_53234/m.79503 type:complete len:381 (+) Transcript_53234:809-1951(+)